MLTYTLKAFVTREPYDEAIQHTSVYSFLSRVYFTKENGEEGILYTIYDLKRDGKSIRFLKEETEVGDCIVWRYSQGRKE